MDDYKELESDFLKLKEESKRDREENDHLRELIDKLSSDLENIKKPRKRNLNGVLYDNEDVEALKQQVSTSTLYFVGCCQRGEYGMYQTLHCLSQSNY